MIVYGDPSFETTLRPFATELRHRAFTLRADPGEEAGHRLNHARTLLIQAGQLEQAVHDADAAHPALQSVCAVTDHAALAFLGQWRTVCGEPPLRHIDGDALGQMVRSLDAVVASPDVSVRVKVPEGFAFYTLYPEQYCAAALGWCADHPHAAGPVLVAGVRSIGTSLSALVAALLTDEGHGAHRTTVRPTGHPFDRRAALDPAIARGATHALVVDEGPGISGSSMAAVAQACEDAGIPPENIAFLPGHAHEPGHAASAVVRERWNRTRRYVVPLPDLRWGDRALTDLLAAATERLARSPVTGVADLSAGQWRHHVCPHERWFPAVCAPFERTKYLIATADGERLLWKFAGLTGDAERDFARLTVLAEKGWTPAPVAVEHGFIALPWVANLPLGADDAHDAGTGDALARYVLDAAGPPLSPDEQRRALEHLREMLYWNTKESLGDAATDRAKEWSDWMTARPRVHPVPRYGDGRLAPHEWIGAPDGHLIKTDCTGHDRDHTVVGPQPLAWDVAGALVEWRLDSLPLPKDAPIDPAELPFYRMAYAAFRLGQCALCASLLSPGHADRVRLLASAERYRDELARGLARPPQ